MKIRIALAGELPQDQRLYGKIDFLMKQISGYFARGGEDFRIQIQVSPSYTGSQWIDWNEAQGFAVCEYLLKGQQTLSKEPEQVIYKDSKITRTAARAMCTKADLFLIVWNEDVSECGGSTWELLQMAYERSIPCIWLSSKSEQICCLQDSYYMPYSPDYLKEACPVFTNQPPEAAEAPDEKKPSFWVRMRRRFLKKYSAQQNVYPVAKDCLLTEEGAAGEEAAAAKSTVQGNAEHAAADAAAVQADVRRAAADAAAVQADARCAAADAAAVQADARRAAADAAAVQADARRAAADAAAVQADARCAAEDAAAQDGTGCTSEDAAVQGNAEHAAADAAAVQADERRAAEDAAAQDGTGCTSEDVAAASARVSSGEKIRRFLLSQYNRYDAEAVKWNEMYQSVLYERSVLPFITTAFLAVGFYAETLLGTTISMRFPAIEFWAVLATGILAGIGFLVHGCLNFYVFRLSRSKQIDSWQKNFVKNRALAEFLRVLIHFMPYGIRPDLRKLCGDDPELFPYLSHCADEYEPDVQRLDAAQTAQILTHVDEMLEDQIAYHESSASRYQRIVTSLEKWGKAVFAAGFTMVLLRGILQFIITPLQRGLLQSIAVPLQNTVFLNDDYVSILRSALNCAALMLPAWAGFFTSKLSQNNFRYNYENNLRTAERLKSLRTRIKRLRENDNPDIELLDNLVEEISQVMLVDDIKEWKTQYMNSKIKPL